MKNAFRVRADHVTGLPDWADRERYSIVAKAPAAAASSEAAPDQAPCGALQAAPGNARASGSALVVVVDRIEKPAVD